MTTTYDITERGLEAADLTHELLDILNCLAYTERPLTIADIAYELKLPNRKGVANSLDVLEKYGLVYKEEVD